MAAGEQRHPHRRLSSDDGFSGQWDGQWKAASSAEEYYGDLNDDGEGNEWLDTAGPDSLTPEQIVTYVGLGILGFMALLCFASYPEVVAVPCRSLRDWCFSRSSLVNGALEMNCGSDGDYVGGRAKTKKKKKKEEPSKSGDGGFEMSKDIGLL